jgi:hypothetical protein
VPSWLAVNRAMAVLIRVALSVPKWTNRELPYYDSTISLATLGLG